MTSRQRPKNIFQQVADLASRLYKLERNLPGPGGGGGGSVPPHAMVGASHTGTGLTVGNVIRATATSTFNWQQLQHTDLGAIGANDHHSQAHGAADHTDITRTLWITAAQTSVNDGATQGTQGTLPNQISIKILADNATNGVYWVQGMPLDVVAATALNIRIVWAPQATDAASHAVRWSVDALDIMTTTEDAAGTTTAFTGASQAHTVKVPYIEATQQILASISASSVIRLNVRRLGSDGADNYAGNVGLIGVYLDYTANQ